MTTDLTASNFLIAPLRISSCTRPTCSSISITPITSSKSYTIGTAFTSLEQSPLFSPNDPACPVAFTATITQNPGKSSVDLTSTLLNTLFKIYDLPDYRQKAYSAQMTNDDGLAAVYEVKLSGALASSGKVKAED